MIKQGIRKVEESLNEALAAQGAIRLTSLSPDSISSRDVKKFIEIGFEDESFPVVVVEVGTKDDDFEDIGGDKTKPGIFNQKSIDQWRIFSLWKQLQPEIGSLSARYIPDVSYRMLQEYYTCSQFIIPGLNDITVAVFELKDPLNAKESRKIPIDEQTRREIEVHKNNIGKFMKNVLGSAWVSIVSYFWGDSYCQNTSSPCDMENLKKSLIYASKSLGQENQVEKLVANLEKSANWKEEDKEALIKETTRVLGEIYKDLSTACETGYCPSKTYAPNCVTYNFYAKTTLSDKVTVGELLDF